MRSTTRVLVLVMVACLIPAVAFAQGGGGYRQNGGGQQHGFMPGAMGMGAPCAAQVLRIPPAMMVERMTALNLSDEQKQKLTDILTKAETTLAPIRKKGSDTNAAVRTALFDSTKTAAEVGTALTEASKAEAELTKAEFGVWSQIRTLLSPDQLTKLGESMGRFGSGRPGGGAGGWTGGQSNGGGGFAGGGAQAGPGGDNPPPPPPPAGE